jgi:hypothetical protein
MNPLTARGHAGIPDGQIVECTFDLETGQMRNGFDGQKGG